MGNRATKEGEVTPLDPKRAAQEAIEHHKHAALEVVLPLVSCSWHLLSLAARSNDIRSIELVLDYMAPPVHVLDLTAEICPKGYNFYSRQDRVQTLQRVLAFPAGRKGITYEGAPLSSSGKEILTLVSELGLAGLPVMETLLNRFNLDARLVSVTTPHVPLSASNSVKAATLCMFGERDPVHVETLIERGAIVSCLLNVPYPHTPLTSICADRTLLEKDQIALARTYLVHGSDPSFLGSHTSCPLHSAVTLFRVNLIELLLDWGAETSSVPQIIGVAEKICSSAGNCALLTLLVARGAQIVPRNLPGKPSSLDERRNDAIARGQRLREVIEAAHASVLIVLPPVLAKIVVLYMSLSFGPAEAQG